MFYGYDKVSNLTSLTDRNGNVTSFAYDERDRETSVTDAELNVTSYGYDVESRLTSLTDPNGNLTEYVYDDLDRLLEVKEQNPAGPAGDTTGGPVSTFAYDVMSNLVSETDANGNATDYQYDSVYRLSRVTGQNPASPGSGSTSGGPETDYFYDAVHNLTLVQDANNNNTFYTYDDIDRRVSVEDALNNITTFTYDGNSNLLSVNDADSNSTTYVYDALNRLTSETDEQGQVMSYAYDAHGNVAEMTDRNDRVTTYVYDGLHRLTQEDWYETVAKTNRQNRISYGYDAEGNLTSIADNFSAYTFTYDDIYRLTQEAGTNSTKTTGTVDVTLGYTYDNASNRLTMSETTPGSSGSTGQVTNYQYDRLNRLVGMDQAGDASSGDKSIGFDYDALGLVSQIQRYNDTTKTNQVSRSDFAYDGLNRITNMDHRDQADSVIAFYDYQYDGVGNLTGQMDTDGSVTFNVNARNEVTVADYDPADVRSDESYNYDATSDLSSRNGNSFTEGDDNEVTGDGTYTYAYDDEGNLILQTLIADGSYREFTYDHRNRLTSVTDKTAGGVITSSVTYTYDALNRRILKDDGVTQTAYSYDGSDVQLEFVNGVLAVRYFQGLGIDDVFAEENVGIAGDDGLDWLLSDRQGTIKDVLDGSGDLAQHVIFDTYGNLLQVEDGTGSVQTVNDLLTEYGFTSRRYETETGLWYFRARYYNSELGRFISRDPAGFVDGPSLYTGYFASHWAWDPTGNETYGWDDYWSDANAAIYWNSPPTCPCNALANRKTRIDEGLIDDSKSRRDLSIAIANATYYGNFALEAGVTTVATFTPGTAELIIAGSTLAARGIVVAYRAGKRIYKSAKTGRVLTKSDEIAKANKMYDDALEVARKAAEERAKKLARLKSIPWGKYKETGCKEVANKIVKSIGGKRIHITPKRTPFLGKRNGIETGWDGHYAAFKDGRIYDAMTGPGGLSVDDYKKGWEFADGINFGL